MSGEVLTVYYYRTMFKVGVLHPKKSFGKQVPEVSPQLLFSYLGVLIICRHKFASYNGVCSSLWVGKVQHGTVIVNILKYSSGN